MKLLVLGDLMLDCYLHGSIRRISPEAPVPIVDINHKENRLGGAANTAFNCIALGARVTIGGVIGATAEGELIRTLMETVGMDTSLLQVISDRRTTVKTRIFSRDQQVIRYDEEDNRPIPLQIEHHFIEDVLKFLQIEKPDLVIFEDYNKGFLTENIIQQVIRHCQHLNIPTAVDPKRVNFWAYRGVTLFKPNLKEVKEGTRLNINPADIAQLKRAHDYLTIRLQHEISLITLSEAGIFYQKGEKNGILPALQRTIRDVSGAGDTVMAVSSMVYAITQDPQEAAFWANLAGGLVCEQIGVVPIDPKLLFQEIIQYFQ